MANRNRKVDPAHVKARMAAGESVAGIAASLGVSRSSVYSALGRNDKRLRAEEVAAAVMPKLRRAVVDALEEVLA